MATKPTRHGEWALILSNDPTSGNPNRDEPFPQYKDSGQAQDEILPRPFLNDTLYLHDAWNKWAEEEIDAINTVIDNVSRQDVVSSANPTLTSGMGNRYYTMSGTVITLANVALVASVEEIGSTIRIRTSDTTTISTDVGVTLEGFSGSIPSGRTITFIIEDLPSGSTTIWGASLSAGA